MNEDKNIFPGVPAKDGMTVPENYFSDFAKRMAESLPENDLERSARENSIRAPKSFWQRVRPYAYMAAMFAGVWCMLKMFTMITGANKTSFDQNPILADALSNETFFDEFIIDDVDQWDLYDEMYEGGEDLDNIANSVFYEPSESGLE